jgi:superfamily II DNA or RNA helicase
MVKELDQGHELLREGQERKMNIVFLQGASPAKAREEVRLIFNRKEIKTVIATAVWKEGIDIPTLDCVINACGGKSEIQTLQALGRGLRVTEEKSTVEIIDFLDPYRYLARHTVMRLQTYVKNRWL